MKDIYNNILLKFADDSSHEFDKSEQSNESDSEKKYAVMIEPRYDKVTRAVIKNFMYFLTSKNNWKFILYSYSSFKDKIKEDFPTIKVYSIDKLYTDSSIYFDEKGEPNISIETYNKILLNTDFWNRIKGENIAIFQRDCIMYRPIQEYLYMCYDFSGANYYNKKDIAPFNGGINGGFSLRKKSAMIDCINRVSWESIREYKQKIIKISMIDCINRASCESIHEYKQKIIKILDATDEENVEHFAEDVFFTFACEILHKNIPDKINRTFLSVETDINLNASVHHGWQYSYHDTNTAISYLENSPLFSKYIDESFKIQFQDNNKHLSRISHNINETDSSKIVFEIGDKSEKNLSNINETDSSKIVFELEDKSEKNPSNINETDSSKIVFELEDKSEKNTSNINETDSSKIVFELEDKSEKNTSKINAKFEIETTSFNIIVD